MQPCMLLEGEGIGVVEAQRISEKNNVVFPAHDVSLTGLHQGYQRAMCQQKKLLQDQAVKAKQGPNRVPVEKVAFLCVENSMVFLKYKDETSRSSEDGNPSNCALPVST